MKKIEITHKKSVLSFIESLCKRKVIQGYTSVKVASSFGALNGDFEYDHLSDVKYHTFIYEEDERFEQTLKTIKEEGEEHEVKIFYSEISKAF
jgi:hypothetical protein